MLFKLTNKKKSRETHCGVLEFVADEGRIYIPYWVRAKNSQVHKHHGIQWTRGLYSVVITCQSNPPISQFNSLCNELYECLINVCIQNVL